MAIALGNDFLDFRGDAAVANGWFKYARRLLERLPISADHARLNVWEACLALIGRQDTAEGHAWPRSHCGWRARAIVRMWKCSRPR